MKRYIQLFENFGTESMCCDPMAMIQAFKQGYGDSLRWAAFSVQGVGFEQAEIMAEDPEDAQAVRMLKGMITTPPGVDPIKMLDFMENSRMDIDYFADMFYTFVEDGPTALQKTPEGRKFLRDVEDVLC